VGLAPAVVLIPVLVKVPVVVVIAQPRVGIADAIVDVPAIALGVADDVSRRGAGGAQRPQADDGRKGPQCA
jgi:hypothetical protein